MFLVIFFERFDGFEKLFVFSLINIKTQLLKRSKEVLVAKKKIRGPSHLVLINPFQRNKSIFLTSRRVVILFVADLTSLP